MACSSGGVSPVTVARSQASGSAVRAPTGKVGQEGAPTGGPVGVAWLPRRSVATGPSRRSASSARRTVSRLTRKCAAN